MADTRIGGVYVDIKARNAQFLRATKQTLKTFNIQRREFRALRRDAQQFSRTLKGIRTQLLAFGSVGAAIGFVKPFADFQDVLFRVRATTGATAAEYEKLSQVTQDLGRQTRFTATDAAKGAQLLGQAGFNVAQINEALSGVLDTALIGNTDLATAADVVASSLGAYQFQATETARVVDVLAKATTTANLNLTDFFESSKLLAPAAASLGVSFEEMAAAITTVADVGIRGSQAGTALRQSFLQLQAPTAAGIEALEKYGIALAEVNVTDLGIQPVVERLAEANIAIEDLADIVGLRAVSAFQGLVQSSEAFGNSVNVFETAQGAAADFAAALEGSVTDSFLKVVSALQGFAIAFTTESGLGDAVANLFAGVSEQINALTDNISNVADRIIHVFTLIGGVIALRVVQIVAAMAGIPITLGTITAASQVALGGLRLGFANLAAGAQIATLGVRGAFTGLAASTAAGVAGKRSQLAAARVSFTGLQLAMQQTAIIGATALGGLRATTTAAVAGMALSATPVALALVAIPAIAAVVVARNPPKAVAPIIAVCCMAN